MILLMFVVEVLRLYVCISYVPLLLAGCVSVYWLLDYKQYILSGIQNFRATAFKERASTCRA